MFNKWYGAFITTLQVYGFCFQTLFDVASLTKVLATTTAAMILYQKGQLDLGIR